MSEIFKIESVSQIHEMAGYEKPKHPLITLLESSKIRSTIPIIDIQVTSELYTISFKSGNECRIKYGRQNYDFKDGSLIFLAPDQVIEPVSMTVRIYKHGEEWILLFHPDLIRKSQCSLRRMSQ